MRTGLLLLPALVCGAMPVVAQTPDASWRRTATPADRTRLRRWRTAWTEALAQARARVDGAAAITADPDLFAPDRALSRPMPPPGEYRCRTIKLGTRGTTGLPYVAYPWFRCRLFGGQLAKVGGSQRLGGTILPDTDSRAVLLATLLLGDERRPMAYGRDAGRDMAGLVERIGPARWRVAFPYPTYESLLDLLELAPAGGAVETGAGEVDAGVPDIGGRVAR